VLHVALVLGGIVRVLVLRGAILEDRQQPAGVRVVLPQDEGRDEPRNASLELLSNHRAELVAVLRLHARPRDRSVHDRSPSIAGLGRYRIPKGPARPGDGFRTSARSSVDSRRVGRKLGSHPGRGCLIVLVAVLATSSACTGSSHPAPTPDPSGRSPASVTRLRVTLAGYRLPVPVQREVAAASGTGILLAGGLDAGGASADGVFFLNA